MRTLYRTVYRTVYIAHLAGISQNLVSPEGHGVQLSRMETLNTACTPLLIQPVHFPSLLQQPVPEIGMSQLRDGKYPFWD
mgnify:CR=1 FL=1